MSSGRSEVGPPKQILFVEEITELIAESLPEFWKLGQAYVSGSLFHGMQMVAERQRNQQENCDGNREKFEVLFSTDSVYSIIAGASKQTLCSYKCFLPA